MLTSKSSKLLRRMADFSKKKTLPTVTRIVGGVIRRYSTTPLRRGLWVCQASRMIWSKKTPRCSGCQSTLVPIASVSGFKARAIGRFLVSDTGGRHYRFGVTQKRRITKSLAHLRRFKNKPRKAATSMS